MKDLKIILILIFLFGVCYPLTVINSCQDLTSGVDTEFVLGSNLTTTGGCIIFSGSDIILDCNGHSITGDLSIGDYGVYVRQENITIKNCVVSNFSTGIYFDSANQSFMFDNTIHSCTTGILDFEDNAGQGYNSIHDNIVYNTANGLLAFGSNSLIYNNDIYNSTTSIQIQDFGADQNKSIFNNTFNSSTNIDCNSGDDTVTLYDNYLYGGSTNHIKGGTCTINYNTTVGSVAHGNYYEGICDVLDVYDTDDDGYSDVGVVDNAESFWTGNGEDNGAIVIPCEESACGTLDKPYTDYVLTQNVTAGSDSNCIVIDENNIDFSCEGYTIFHGDGTGNIQSGVRINDAGDNSNVHDCNIVQNWSNDYKFGIYSLPDADNLTIYNNNVSGSDTSADYAILSFGAGSEFYGNNITTTGASAYAWFRNENSTMYDNYFNISSTSNGYVILGHTSVGNYNEFYENNITGGDGFWSYNTYSDYNTVFKNEIESEGNCMILSSGDDSQYTIFSFNNYTSCGVDTFAISGATASDNLIYENYMTSGTYFVDSIGTDNRYSSGQPTAYLPEKRTEVEYRDYLLLALPFYNSTDDYSWYDHTVTNNGADLDGTGYLGYGADLDGSSNLTVTLKHNVTSYCLWQENPAWEFVCYNGSANFKNGVADSTANTYIDCNANVCTLGYNGSSNLTGAIDQVYMWQRELTGAEIVQVYNGFTYLNGAVLYVPMDDDEDELIYDFTTTNTASTYETSKTKFGYEFDGSTSVINVADDEVFDTGGEITVSHWFKTNATSITDDGMVSHDASNYKYMTYITLDGAILRFFIRTASGVSFATKNYGAGEEINDGEWHHIVGTFDKSLASDRLKIYVDGELADEVDAYAENISAGDEGIAIGKFAGTAFFNGSLDEVIIYDRALTDTEILALYELGYYEHGNNYTNTASQELWDYNIDGYADSGTDQPNNATNNAKWDGEGNDYGTKNANETVTITYSDSLTDLLFRATYPTQDAIQATGQNSTMGIYNVTVNKPNIDILFKLSNALSGLNVKLNDEHNYTTSTTLTTTYQEIFSNATTDGYTWAWGDFNYPTPTGTFEVNYYTAEAD